MLQGTQLNGHSVADDRVPDLIFPVTAGSNFGANEKLASNFPYSSAGLNPE